MPVGWTTSHGLDLLVELDRRDLRGSLERSLRAAIRDGRLAPGTRLPSTRSLARDLGVARGTVTHTYEQLSAEGYLEALRGSGTTVARAVGSVRPANPAAAGPTRMTWDLTPGSPDVSSFPRAAWLAATKRVVSSCSSDVFGYGDPAGRPELRRALAAYLGRVRGVVATPDRLVICAGYGPALSLLCRAMRNLRHQSLAFENPSFAQHRHIAAAAGLRIVGAPVDERGVRVADVPGNALVVTPAHQFPLGVTLHPQRRTDLAAWAASPGRLVVEDDYDGEFRYDRQPVGALQGLAPEGVVYAGTASKTLAPALRLAWLALPERWLRPVLEAGGSSHPLPGVIEQLVLAELIDSGGYDRHVRLARARYRRRRDQLVEAVARSAPSVRVGGISAGLHAVLLLGPGVSDGPTLERRLVAAAAERGLAVLGLADFWHQSGGADDASRPSGLVIGYATPPEHAFRPALTTLEALLADIVGAAH
jgi:GntR family transcriptional regulator/MocR family aminotransferase